VESFVGWNCLPNRAETLKIPTRDYLILEKARKYSYMVSDMDILCVCVFRFYET